MMRTDEEIRNRINSCKEREQESGDPEEQALLRTRREELTRELGKSAEEIKHCLNALQQEHGPDHAVDEMGTEERAIVRGEKRPLLARMVELWWVLGEPDVKVIFPQSS